MTAAPVTRLRPIATRAAKGVGSAQRALSKARLGLARRTKPGHPSVIHDGPWRAIDKTLQRHRERLLAFPNVVGVGVGFRRVNGVRRYDERAIIVFVNKKVARAELRRVGGGIIPRFLVGAHGARVPIDVVAFGELLRHVDAGASVAPGTIAERGTLGTFAVDMDSGLTVALTAMHVVGNGVLTAPDPGLVADSPDTVRLGMALRGSVPEIDAAAVSVDSPQSPSGQVIGIGPIAGWRPVANPADVGTAVAMRGAQTATVVYGRIVEPSISLPAYDLENAMLVDIPSTNGDSGAAILDGDNIVLGLLIGESTTLGHKVFSSIGGVLARLRCDIPTSPSRSTQ